MARHEHVTVAGQGCVISRPNTPSTGRLLVLCHGGGLDFSYAINCDPATVPYYRRLYDMIEYLCNHGFVVASPANYDTSLSAADQGSASGNPATTTQNSAVITALRSSPLQEQFGIGGGKYGFLTISAGVMIAANHARTVGQSNIAGILSFLPAVNGPFYRGTDDGGDGPGGDPAGTDGIAGPAGYATTNAAWEDLATSLATTPNDAFFTNTVYPTYWPAAIAPSITVPWGFWTNSNDVLAPPAHSDTVAALVPNGLGTRLDMGPALMGEASANAANIYGHNFSEIVASEVLDFLDTWAW